MKNPLTTMSNSSSLGGYQRMTNSSEILMNGKFACQPTITADLSSNARNIHKLSTEFKTTTICLQ